MTCTDRQNLRHLVVAVVALSAAVCANAAAPTHAQPTTHASTPTQSATGSKTPKASPATALQPKRLHSSKAVKEAIDPTMHKAEVVTGSRCEQMSNYFLGMTQAQMHKEGLDKQCIDYLATLQRTGAIDLQAEVGYVADQPPPTKIALNTNTPPPNITHHYDLAPQLTPYTLTLAGGLNYLMPHHSAGFTHPYTGSSSRVHNLTAYKNPMVQYFVGFSRDVDFNGSDRHAVEAEYLHLLSKIKKIQVRAGSSTLDLGTNGDLQIDAWFANLYKHNQYNHDFQYHIGLGAGMAHFNFDFSGVDAGKAFTLKGGHKDPIYQGIIGAKFKLSTNTQFLVDYRFIFAEKQPVSFVSSCGTSNYREKILINTLNFGWVYRFRSTPNTPTIYQIGE